MRAGARDCAEVEARQSLGVCGDAPVILVEDSDAHDEIDGPVPIVLPVQFADGDVGRLAFGRRQESDAESGDSLSLPQSRSK